MLFEVQPIEIGKCSRFLTMPDPSHNRRIQRNMSLSLHFTTHSSVYDACVIRYLLLINRCK